MVLGMPTMMDTAPGPRQLSAHARTADHTRERLYVQRRKTELLLKREKRLKGWNGHT